MACSLCQRGPVLRSYPSEQTRLPCKEASTQPGIRPAPARSLPVTRLVREINMPRRLPTAAAPCIPETSASMEAIILFVHHKNDALTNYHPRILRQVNSFPVIPVHNGQA